MTLSWRAPYLRSKCLGHLTGTVRASSLSMSRLSSVACSRCACRVPRASAKVTLTVRARQRPVLTGAWRHRWSTTTSMRLQVQRPVTITIKRWCQVAPWTRDAGMRCNLWAIMSTRTVSARANMPVASAACASTATR